MHIVDHPEVGYAKPPSVNPLSVGLRIIQVRCKNRDVQVSRAKTGGSIYWAHSDRNGLKESDPNARWQPLAQHLRQVGRLAEQLAQAARPEDTAFHQNARAT